MAEFYVSVSNERLAEQVASLINNYNGWYTRFSQKFILFNPARYFLEIENDTVVGCAAYIQENNKFTKIQHVCVLPNKRRKGIAKKLVKLAVENATTDYVYMTIHESNIPSLRMAESLGFTCIHKSWFRDHWTLTFGRSRYYDRSRYAAARN